MATLVLNAALAISVSGGVSHVRESGDVLAFPGADPSEVVSFLRDIARGYEDAMRPLENRLVRGRVSVVRKQWTPGATLGVLDPQWQPFTLVHKNGKRRYEQDVLRSDGASDESYTVFRLLDNEGIHIVSGHFAAIEPLDDIEVRWAHRTFDWSTFAMARCNAPQGWLPVRRFCDLYAKRVESPDGYFTKEDRQLRCYVDAGRYVVEDVPAPGTATPDSDMRWINAFDSRKGFQLVSAIHEIGREGGIYCVRENTAVVVEAIAEGVYYIKSGTSLSSVRGKHPDKDGGAGWVKRDVVVDDVSFGDFAYDEKLLTPDSLSVPVGALVVDGRVDPPVQFTRGVSPIDEEILRRSATRRAARNIWHNMLLWIVVAVVAVCVIGAAAMWRRRRT